MFGAHFLYLLLMWGVALVAVGAVLYVAVRLAVLHALKSHTRWVESGQR